MSRLSNFGQVFAHKVLEKTYQNSIVDSITNRNYEGEIKKPGDRVNILSFLNSGTLGDYVVGTDMNSEALVDALCDADVLADSLALVEALCDADVLADSLALVNALCEAETLSEVFSDSLVDTLSEALVLADSEALAKALIDADVFADSLALVEADILSLLGVTV